jgi:phosphoglycolate phosphatase
MNVPSVMVTFGPAGMAVADLKPDALIHHYNELPAVAAGLLS